MEKELAIYLSGLVDGDGSITISITKSRTKNPSILFSFQVRIALKENDGNNLVKLQEETKIGKIYYSNKGKPNGICSWQTTNISDAIQLAQEIYPNLRIKHDKCKRFIDAAKFWRDTTHDLKGRRIIGRRLRTREEITRIMRVALDLNYDRQTERYRERKGWDYWKKEIERLYPS